MSILTNAIVGPARGSGVGSSCLAVALAAVVALATATPAAGQASRTRPSGGSSGGTAAGSAGTRSSSPPPATASSAPSSVSRTRPGAGGDDERTRVVRDERGASGGGDHDVVIVNPWGWWHSYFWRYGWDTWGWYGHPGYGGYGGYGPVWYPRRQNERMGALDLDLKPGDTQIWLDGQLIGIADRFDGWPGYLWLDEGDYHFVFFREGYRTIAREYRIHPGLVIDVQDRMVEGESVPAEELVPPRPTPRRDARVRRNEELRRRAAEAEAAEAAGAPAEVEDESDWRARAPQDVVEEELGVGTLRLTVVPPDASVYLDGRFLGTGEELARLRRGLAIDAGEHLLEVVRPGHAPIAERLVVEEGDDIELEVELEPRP